MQNPFSTNENVAEKRKITKESYRTLSIQMIKWHKKMTVNNESYRTLSIQMIRWHEKGQLIKKVTEPFLYKWWSGIKTDN